MQRTMGSLSWRLWLLASIVAFALALFTHATVARAQGVTGAAITGNVATTTGAPVPNAHVELRNTTTGEVFRATTGADGVYFIDNVPPGGPYTLTAAADGYPMSSQTDLQLELNQRLAVDLTMTTKPPENEPQQVETITVVKRVDRLNDHGRTGATTQVGSYAIEHLPLQGRNFTDLISTAPQANGNSIAGQNNRYNNIQIDGGANNDTFGLTSQGTPGGLANATPISLEAIKEFNIQIAPFDVRQSSFTGGLVNAITKSGSNEFHGTAFTTFINKSLAGFQDDPTFLNFQTIQFGASVGGPIVENKLFFFASVELQAKSSSFGNQFQIGGVDSAADMMRAGFTAADAQRFASILSTKYGVNNVGDALSPDIGNPYQTVFGKLTYAIDDHSRAEVSYNFVNGTLDSLTRSPTAPALPATPAAAGNLRDGYQLSNSGYTQDSSNNTARGKLTSSWGNVSNELIASASFLRDERVLPNVLPLILVDVGKLGNSDSWLAAGGERFSHQNILDQNIYDISDNVTIGIGSQHRLSIGTSNEFQQLRDVFFQAAYGVWAFSSLDALDAGTPAAYQRRFAVSPLQEAGTSDYGVAQFGVYLQDEWTPFKGFTLTPGIRLDVPVLSGANVNPVLVHNATFPIDTSQVPSGNLLWSPRVGFNWDIEGNSNTIVRGGAGIFTGRPAYVWVANAYSVNGLSQVQLTCVAASGGVPTFTVDPHNQPTSCSGSGSTPVAPTNQGEIDYFDPGTKYPQNFQAALGADRRLPWGLTGSVDLLYSHDVNGWYTTDENLIQQPGVNAEGRVLYGSFAATGFRANPSRIDTADITNAVKVYNKSGSQVISAAFTLAKRFARRIDVSIGYAYTNSQDLISLTSSQGFSNFQFAPLDGTLDNRNARPSNFDRTHRITATGTVELPLGFNAGLIYIGQSGTPYTWTVNGDVNADGVNGNDLVFVPKTAADISLMDPTQWTALDAFIKSQDCLQSARGQFVQRGACRNPFSNILNLRLGWGINTYKKQRFEVQVDIFDFLNLLNSNWGLFDQVTGFENAPAAFLRAVGYDATANRPIYTFVDPRHTDGRVEATSYSPTLSRWRIQLGARYDF